MRKFAVAGLLLVLAACASHQSAEVETRGSRGTTPGTPDARPAPSPQPPASASSSAPAVQPAPATPRKAGGGAYYKDDGPGDNPPPDMASIPDAQPKREPLHPRANRPYQALGQNYTPMQAPGPYKATGVASWYGRRFNGMPTSSGERYDMYAMTAAHPTLPIPSYVRVTNLENARSVIVRVNDRGPFHKERLIDLSYTAAWKLGYVDKGSTRVEVEAIIPGDVTTTVAVAAPAPAMTDPVTVPQEEVKPYPMPLNGIYLQLGSFASQRNAAAFRDSAKQALSGVHEILLLHSDAERTRVLLGPFASMAEAREMAERVADQLDVRPFPVQR